MYYSVSEYCIELIMYLLLLCFVSLILCTIIGFWGVLLFLLFFGCILFVLYLFRYANICPAHLSTLPNTILWPSEGKVISIINGSFLRLTGVIINIESSWKDCYTHVSPICGKILKIIHTDIKSQYKGAIYIQITNSIYQVDLLIRSTNTIVNEVDYPIIYVKEGDIVYASQPLGISIFGAHVKLIIDHQNKLNISHIYPKQYIYNGEFLV